MIPGGYVLQPRKLDYSELFKMPPVTRELWSYLIRKVNRKNSRTLKKGQGYFRLSEIQKDLEWHSGYRVCKYSRKQLLGSLRRLRGGNMVVTMKVTHGILITVCNYDYYQDPKNYGGVDGGNTEGTTEGTNKYNNEEYNKKEKEKEKEKEKPPEEEITSTPSRRIQSYTDIFNTFFDAYTKITKMGDDKEPAYREWRLLSQEDRIKAMKSVRDYYEDCLKQKRLPKMAKTYLKDKTFNNDYSRSSRFHPDGRVKLVI